MFLELIFLVLALLLVSIFSATNSAYLAVPPLIAFLAALCIYAFLLAAIASFARFFKRKLQQKKEPLLKVVCTSLLIYLIFFQFILRKELLFLNSSGLNALFSLILYLFGLYTFHYFSYPSYSKETSFALKIPSKHSYALSKIRLLIPFALPFIAFSFLIDLFSLFEENTSAFDFSLLLFVAMAIFFPLVVLFYPLIIQWMWGCGPIEDRETKERLEKICEKAHFTHAGLKIWKIMDRTYTAGIIGVLPKYRYVMFTRQLLQDLPKEAIDAVLAHEIGHSFHKHLLIYPFIILGMAISVSLYSLFFSEATEQFFALQNLILPSFSWNVFYALALFFPYAFIAALYFRYIFGYFSRLFERQADLHVFRLGIPAKQMELALDELAKLTGNSHFVPNWHHYSIQKRILFLKKARKLPKYIAGHHCKVKRSLFLFFLSLIAATLFILSPVLPSVPPFRQMANFANASSSSFADFFCSRARKMLAEKYMVFYKLKGDKKAIFASLVETIKDYSTTASSSFLEFLLADKLFSIGEYSSSTKMMTAAWKSAGKEIYNKKVQKDFILMTEKIIKEYHGPEIEELKAAQAAALKTTQGEPHEPHAVLSARTLQKI